MIESFITVTTHAATLREKIAPEVQRLSSLCHSIFGMTLLTSGFGVFLLKHWPEPELVPPVTLYFTRRRAAITPVAACATKPFGGVNLQDFFVGVTHERARKTIRLLARPIRRQIFGSQVERFANAGVANFAAVDDVKLIDADLMRKNGVVKLLHLLE